MTNQAEARKKMFAVHADAIARHIVPSVTAHFERNLPNSTHVQLAELAYASYMEERIDYVDDSPFVCVRLTEDEFKSFEYAHKMAVEDGEEFMYCERFEAEERI